MIKEIEAKTFIGKSNLPEADYVVNPYVGCTHSCSYCYARFMKRFTLHNEPWGSFVDVKMDISKKTKKELEKIPDGSTILLSSVTDPYQPVEQKYKSTRAFLENAVGKNINLSILTKSSLVLRDIDLLKKMPNVNVGLSFSSDNDNIRRIFEPGAGSVDEKLHALTVLHREGIQTYAFLGPILPEITDVDKIFSLLAGTSVDSIMAENLNMNGAVYTSVMNVISKHYPNLVTLYSQLKKHSGNYWEPIKDQLVHLSSQYNIPLKIYFDH